MKEATRMFISKLLALSEAAAFFYPVILTLRLVLFKDDGGLSSLALYIALLCLGFIAGRVLFREELSFSERLLELAPVKFILFSLNITEKIRFISVSAAICTAVLPIVAALLVFNTSGLFRCLLEIPSALIPYYMALRNSNKNFTDIMSRNRLGTGFAIMICTMEVSAFYQPARYLKPYLFGIAYFCILVYLILKNQEDIDSNIYNRKNIEKSILPKNLRSFNLKAVIVIFAGILLLFNLKDVVVFLMNVAAFIIQLVLALIVYITGHIMPPPPLKKPGGMPLPDMGQVPQNLAVHPILNFLGNITAYFVVMYFAYRVVLILIRMMPKLFRKLLELVRGLISHTEQDTAEIGDYNDEVETLKPVSEDGAEKEARKRIRKAVRNLKSITDPVERIRYIYGSILGMLPVFGIRPEKSDTPREIMKKVDSSGLMKPDFTNLTGIYESVRYGEEIPDSEAVLQADSSYEAAASLLKNSRR